MEHTDSATRCRHCGAAAAPNGSHANCSLRACSSLCLTHSDTPNEASPQRYTWQATRPHKPPKSGTCGAANKNAQPRACLRSALRPRSCAPAPAQRPRCPRPRRATVPPRAPGGAPRPHALARTRHTRMQIPEAGAHHRAQREPAVHAAQAHGCAHRDIHFSSRRTRARIGIFISPAGAQGRARPRWSRAQIKPNQIKSHQIKSNKITSNKITSNQITSHQTNSNQVSANQVGSNSV